MTCIMLGFAENLPPLPPPAPLPPLPALPALQDLTPMQPFPPPGGGGNLPGGSAPAPTLPSPPAMDGGPDLPTFDIPAVDLGGLGGLPDLVSGFTPISINAGGGTGSGGPVHIPSLPTADTGIPQPNFPSIPGMPPSTGTIDVSIGENLPQYNVQAPALLDLELPDPIAVVMPDEPLLMDVSAPPPPNFVLPPAPTLLELAIPEPPAIELPLFEESLGARPELPDTSLVYYETEYHSQLLSAAHMRVGQLLMDEHATGIVPQLEQALWQRGAGRETSLQDRAVGEGRRLLRARGFDMPEKTLARVLQQALSGAHARANGLARAVAVERANLAQQNLRFAIEGTISAESRLIDKHNAAQARSLEAAKAVIATEIQLFNAQVNLMRADVSAFAMKAEVFKSRLQGALAKVAVYRAQIEAAIARGDVNAQMLAVYQAQIAGVRVVADTYRSQVEAAQQMAEANKGRADQYQARIAAYQAQVTAMQSDYERYAGAVRGQAERVQLFEKQVGAQRARVGAFDAFVKTKVGLAELATKQTVDLPLEQFRAQADAYRTTAEITVEQVRATASTYSASVRAYVAGLGAQLEAAGLPAHTAQVAAEQAIGQANRQIEAGRENLAAAQIRLQMSEQAARSAAQISGQLGAAAASVSSTHSLVSQSSSNTTANSSTDSYSNVKSWTHGTSYNDNHSVSNSTNNVSGQTYNTVVSNVQGRHRNVGRSRTNSTAFSANSNSSTSVHYTGMSSYNNTHNFMTSNECIDRTVSSD
jgi:hypothetical protein